MQLWMEINVVTLHNVVFVATAEALRNQRKRQFNKILECAAFFWGQAVYYCSYYLFILLYTSCYNCCNFQPEACITKQGVCVTTAG